MEIQALGYLGVGTTKLDEWTSLATRGLGMEAIAQLAHGGSKPSVSNGLSFYNTGTALVASTSLSGVTTETPAQGASGCWGS